MDHAAPEPHLVELHNRTLCHHCPLLSAAALCYARAACGRPGILVPNMNKSVTMSSVRKHTASHFERERAREAQVNRFEEVQALQENASIPGAPPGTIWA